MIGHEESHSLIDALLAEQRTLTAVTNFAHWHQAHAGASHASHYRNLVPFNAPRPGQQYAFEVDLDKCSGCKACVTACHALNGLEEDETWRSVGLLVGQSKPCAEGPRGKGEKGLFPSAPLPLFSSAPFQQHVTTACHHCIDPACLNGCPVLAYDKDPGTGIVRHLDDQCIGCQYCVMMCPYDVPKYSERLGIVRKCDLCSARLAGSEAPACVQACPNEAIRITLVETTKVLAAYRPSVTPGEESGKVGTWERGKPRPRSDSPAFPPAHFPSPALRKGAVAPNRFLPASPDPAITVPTTRYLSQRRLAGELEAGDAHEVRAAKPHVPLTFMLVLSQFGTGIALLDAFMGQSSRGAGLTALLLTGVALLVGTLHLGQPLKAWRSFLGWRKSWLSRELIAFGLFLAALGVHVALLRTSTALVAAMSGLIAVFCSAMVYVDTGRPFWSAPVTFGKFFGTAPHLGTVSALVFSSVHIFPAHQFTVAALLCMAGALGKLAVENRVFGHLIDEQSPRLSPLNKTALLLRGRFGLLSRLRVACGIVGGVVLPALLLAASNVGPMPHAAISLAALFLCLGGELVERHLFFVAEAGTKMPGGR